VHIPHQVEHLVCRHNRSVSLRRSGGAIATAVNIGTEYMDNELYSLPEDTILNLCDGQQLITYDITNLIEERIPWTPCHLRTIDENLP
jgi:hypothetical protein